MARSLSKKSENAVLSYITHNCDKVFDIDGILIDAEDFSTSLAANIYRVAKIMATENAAHTDGRSIDKVLLEERVARDFPADYNRDSSIYSDAIDSVYATKSPSDHEVKQHISSVVTSSYRTKISGFLNGLQNEVRDSSNPGDMVSSVEKGVYEFTTGLFRGEDMVEVGKGYTEWLNDLAEAAAEGEIETGIKTGFDLFDTAIGGGLRKGTVNVIAARPKRHKSFLALTMAKNISESGVPVLYLDTELSYDLQMSRMTAMMANIPLNAIETGKFVTDQSMSNAIKGIIPIVESLPLDYVQIGGWGLEQQVSIIRRWYARRVGQDENGNWKPAVVILDYLKLMNSADKGDDKEYEALGYRMSALHDLMRDYGGSMLALAQQNRSGTESEDATTISGSDRIIWLCDNFTILAKKSDAEITASIANAEMNHEADKILTNMKLVVAECRHGPGTQGRHIGLYIDAKDPRVRKEEVTCRISERTLELPYEEDGAGYKR
jgi:replicative DNA helicase